MSKNRVAKFLALTVLIADLEEAIKALKSEVGKIETIPVEIYGQELVNLNNADDVKVLKAMKEVEALAEVPGLLEDRIGLKKDEIMKEIKNRMELKKKEGQLRLAKQLAERQWDLLSKEEKAYIEQKKLDKEAEQFAKEAGIDIEKYMRQVAGEVSDAEEAEVSEE